MALKFKYSSKTEIPPEHLSLYAERDGAFVLDAEGVVDKTKLDEFRTNNLSLKNQLAEFTAKYEGIDPAAVKTLQAAARVFVSGTKLHRAKWRSGAETVQKRCGFGFSMGLARSGPPWPHRPRPECRWCAPLWVCLHRPDPNATPPTGLTPQLSRFFRRTLRWNHAVGGEFSCG